MPPLAAELCSKLPPPRCFEGPYVILDNLLRTLSNVNLEFPVHDNGNAAVKEEPNNGSSNKRKLSKDLSDNEDDNDVPTNDLYRKRQQRRIK